MEKQMLAMIALLVGATLGAAVTFLIVDTDEPQNRRESARIDDHGRDDSRRGEPQPQDEPEDAPRRAEDAPEGNENYKRLLVEERSKTQDLEREVAKLKQRNADLATDNEQLKEQIATIEEAESSHNLRVTFGGLDSIDALRKADWGELGDAYNNMNPMLADLANAIREGRSLDAEAHAKREKQNNTLIKHFASLAGELPTHAGANGEFLHPINMVNILAAQLEAAELPLSDAQKLQLTELGEEYERKWKRLQDGYDQNTWNLEKLLDEAELKQWFRDGMFRVTSQRQKEAVLPPEVEGLIGFDLYSPGLLFQGRVSPIRSASTDSLKDSIKRSMESQIGIDRATLDSGEYIFDDWMATLRPQLQPLKRNESSVFHFDKVYRAGRAQLAAFKQIADGFVTEESQIEEFAAISTVWLPQVIDMEQE